MTWVRISANVKDFLRLFYKGYFPLQDVDVVLRHAPEAGAGLICWSHSVVLKFCHTVLGPVKKGTGD